MDIIAHGLWAAAAYKAANNQRKKRGKKTLSIPWAVFFGVFPDLFAFTLPWIFILFGLAAGTINPATIPGPSSQEPPTPQAFPSYIFDLANALYNISHSLVIFGIIFAAIYLVQHRIQWELGAWLLHIFIDIPTHSYTFFPTPALWPISEWKFTHGIAWSTHWFMVVNYSLLIFVYIFLYVKRRHNRAQPST